MIKCVSLDVPLNLPTLLDSPYFAHLIFSKAIAQEKTKEVRLEVYLKINFQPHLLECPQRGSRLIPDFGINRINRDKLGCITLVFYGAA